MSQWNPQQYDPRQPQQQPWDGTYSRQDYYPPQPFVQPPVQVNVQQNAYGPSRAYTRRGLGPFWTVFHLTMTCLTCGLWIPVWIWHSRSRNSSTSFR